MPVNVMWVGENTLLFSREDASPNWQRCILPFKLLFNRFSIKPIHVIPSTAYEYLQFIFLLIKHRRLTSQLESKLPGTVIYSDYQWNNRNTEFRLNLIQKVSRKHPRLVTCGYLHFSLLIYVAPKFYGKCLPAQSVRLLPWKADLLPHSGPPPCPVH